MTSAYGSTSGTESRDARPLMEGLMIFGLRGEIEALRAEQPYQDGDRNAATLAKEVDFRVLLSVLRAGATIDEQDGDARASIHVLEGRASLRMEGEASDLEASDIAVVDAGRPWFLTAGSDCAVLLTLAWPREKAGV
jgi:quercetin dioxygenase-like cupin family protein